MIQSIIQERESMSASAIHEVSNKWATSQDINGPILTIPFTKEYIIDDKSAITNHYFHMLPEKLNITGTVNPEKLKRGIYEIVVYNSEMSIDGFFDLSEAKKITGAKDIIWTDAFVTMGITDLRGIKEQLLFSWGEEIIGVEPGSKISSIVQSGVTIATPLKSDLIDDSISFNLNLNINGSQSLSFMPLGGVTNVELTSTWDAPSFNGNILPDSREVNEDGFNAQWQVLELNRNFPNSWMDNAVSNQIYNSKFGVDLLLPIDDYQKSMRSAKYAILILTLTFLVFYLVEVMNKRKIHPFQYTLVGLALCLFYILLVAISEHSNFNTSYFISASAIVLMIGLYSLSVFNNKSLSLTLSLILIALYGFLFVTLQLVDFALLIGAIGLALILAATMYVTRKIDWYDLSTK